MAEQRLMVMKQKILLAFILAFWGSCSAGRDVTSVSFRGDCTGFGMKIERTYFADVGFLVVTTGARFEYVLGELKIYQGLGNDLERRLVATLTIDDVGKVEKVEANDDHVLFWSEKLNIGIYGDSTCILAPKVELNISFKGNFKADYEGKSKGELLLIDEAGGMEIYPQRYEAGYKVRRIELGRENWIAKYSLNSSQRVMIAAFPPREFNFEQSYSDRIAHTGGLPLGKNGEYGGTLPSDQVIRAWSKYVNIICIHSSGLYPGKGDWGKTSYNWFVSRLPYKWRFGGPYQPIKPEELHRVVATAHKLDVKVVVYTSPLYYYKSNNADAFFEDVQRLYKKFDLDGFYIDGLYRDIKYPTGVLRDNKIGNWELMRRLRGLVGPNGILYYHGSGDRTAVAVAPNIDALCDFVLYGEAVKFKDFSDDYIQYQVRKFGISNTIGMIKASRKPTHMTDDYVLDQMLKLHGRARWVTTAQLGPDEKWYWPTEPPAHLKRYYRKLDALRSGEN